MKNILFKTFEEDGRQTYVYELPEEVELDEEALDLCEAGSLAGIVPMEYVDDADAFYYDVTGYKTLAKAMSAEVDAADVLETLYGLAKVLVEFKENGVPLSQLLLHKEFIFIDRMTMELKFICLPLEDTQGENAMEAIAHFIRVLLATLRYDISEDGSYVTKLITLANTPDQFNVSIFVNALQDLMSEYGVAYEELAEADSYVAYDEDIATIDASVLEGMPETVSVADMEAEALRQEAMQAEEAGQTGALDAELAVEEVLAETGEEVEAVAEEAETEEAEAVAEETETEEAEAVAEETETEEAEAVAEETETEEAEAVEEETETEEAEAVEEETETEETEAVAEEAETEEAETVEEEAEVAEEPEAAVAYAEEPVAGPRQAVEGRRASGKPAGKASVIWDDETKKKQQEALRRIAEAEQLAQYGNKKLNLQFDTAEEEEEEEYGNTQALPPKEKPHKLELARETIVRPVFDSVFEPIIESIDGPMDEAMMAQSVVPAPTPAKPAKKSKVKLAPPKMDLDFEEEEIGSSSILSKKISTPAEPGLLSQLDSRPENMPKVNPYLVRVNNEERIMITKATFKIGKASFGMDYQVTDNGAISRNHCVIMARDGVYYIRDNKSTNHTYVNGQIVKSGQDVLLTHESTIRIADEDFLFKLR